MILPPNTEKKVVPLKKSSEGSSDVLTVLCKEGAQQMLATALDAEVGAYVAKFSNLLDTNGRRLVVRNGYGEEREIQTGLGGISVKQPRVNDRRLDENGDRIRFSSSILPPYLRRTQSIEELLPWLYLKGISTGDFSEALAALLGDNAPGLSAATIVRLKAGWLEDYKEWSSRSLKGKHYVYLWVDGIYSKVRLGDGEKQCMLVVMGATADGKKELVAVEAGMRESEISWAGVLADLRRRGLEKAPELAIGDGALGFWAALSKEFPDTQWQRCWVHKTANILNDLPKSLQGRAKTMLQEIWKSATRKDAEKAMTAFVAAFGAKYPKVCECLTKNTDELLAFYAFPAQHWQHIRTTNPIESAFATIRLRTKRTKGAGSATTALTMVFKLAQSAEKRWRRLNSSKLLADVIDINVSFVDGIRKAA